MRKFTKEISALLASAAVGTAACAINVSAVTSEHTSYRANAPGTSGISDEVIDDYLPPEAGEAMPEYPTTTTPEEQFPNFAGGTVPPDWQTVTDDMLTPTAGVQVIDNDDYLDDEDFEYTTEEMPPVSGGFVLPDSEILPTTTMPPVSGGFVLPDSEILPTTTMETMPPLAGTELPPDWRTTKATTTTTTTVATTTKELPPLAGDVAIPDWTTTTAPTEGIPFISGQYSAVDGDINSDMELGISDVILLQRWLLGDRSLRIERWGAADFNNNGRLDVYDLCLMKQALIDQRRSKIMTLGDVFRLSKKGMDLTLFDLEPYICKDVGSGIVVDEYKIADSDSIVLVVGHDGSSDKPMYARIKNSVLNKMVDIRSEEFKYVDNEFLS